MWLFITSLLLNAAFLLYLYMDRKFGYWQKRGVIGPVPQVPYGSFPNQRSKHLCYDSWKIYNQFRGMAPFVGCFRGRSPLILLMDADLIKNILGTDFRHFEINEFAQMIDSEANPIFSRNPFMLSKAEWKDKRNEITPAFTPSRLKAMFPLMQTVASGNLITYIKDRAYRGSFDGRDLSNRFTTDVVMTCIYGMDAQALTTETSIVREKAKQLTDFSSIFGPYFLATLMMPWLRKIHKVKIIKDDIVDFFIDLMRQAIKMRESSDNKSMDFMEYILQLREKKNLSELDMAGHTVSFLSDGIDTSSIVLSILLYNLAKNPRVQEKLRNEIKEVRANEPQIPIDKLIALPYLDQVFNETLRMYPAAVNISKVCSSNMTIDYNGNPVEIEKGTVALIPLISIQNDDRFWQKPEQFNPERFDVENGGVKKYKDLGVFFPFGDGPRVCLGQRFGSTQIKMGAFEIVSHFKISVSDKMAPIYEFDEKLFWPLPKGGIWLDFEPIN